MKRPELSVIIPTLNEGDTIGETLKNLACQQEVSMEVIVVDGGSTDATRQIAASSDSAVTVISCSAGRSRQLNAGAASAGGKYLLFLHADSRFSNRRALRQGIDELCRLAGPASTLRVAGRFSLTFGRTISGRSFGYRFFELKARLGRPGCSHGDQGFLMPRPLFFLEGPFSETCELLAQTRFADRMLEKGEWVLLTPELVTSARRFETEGLGDRQTINAVIMACGAAGRDDLVTRIPALYREQAACGRLDTGPILGRLGELIDGFSPAEQQAFWDQVGDYALGNAWQVAFFLDVLCGLDSHWNGREDGTLFMRLFDRHIVRRIDNGVGKSIARMLVRSWFSLKKKSPPIPRTG